MRPGPTGKSAGSAANLDLAHDVLDAVGIPGDACGEPALGLGADLAAQGHRAPVGVDGDLGRLHAALEGQGHLHRGGERGIMHRLAEGLLGALGPVAVARSDAQLVTDVRDAVGVLGDLDGEIPVNAARDGPVQRHDAVTGVDVDAKRVEVPAEQVGGLDAHGDRRVVDRVAGGALHVRPRRRLRAARGERGDGRQHHERVTDTAIHRSLLPGSDRSGSRDGTGERRGAGGSTGATWCLRQQGGCHPAGSGRSGDVTSDGSVAWPNAGRTLAWPDRRTECPLEWIVRRRRDVWRTAYWIRRTGAAPIYMLDPD